MENLGVAIIAFAVGMLGAYLALSIMSRAIISITAGLVILGGAILVVGLFFPGIDVAGVFLTCLVQLQTLSAPFDPTSATAGFVMGSGVGMACVKHGRCN